MAAYTPADLAAHLQTNLDTASAVLALKVATDVVFTYTRGQGFNAVTGAPGDDLAAVALTVAGRIYTNPAATEMTSIDDYTVRYAAFNGWTLPELAVLNTYRRRTA
ncbi:MAG: hypothetical protein ACR2JG_03090 [Geodermatophilaceae bacterium]